MDIRSVKGENAVAKRGRCLRPSTQKALDEGDPELVFGSLTDKQRRFVEEYLIDFNGKQAVLRAGYNSQHPDRLAHQLLKNVAVKFVIDAITESRAKDYTVKPEYVLGKIQRTIEKAESDNNHNAVLRGCELLARHLGMFIERQEISGPNGEAIKYERVQEAANAFTSAIASLIERGGEGDAPLIVERRD